MFQTAERWITRACAGLAIFGGLGLGAAVLITCISALGKGLARFFNGLFGPENIPVALDWIKPVRGEDELVAFAIGFSLFAVLPYVMVARGHITVDLFERLFGRRGNQVLNLLSDAVMAALAWLIFAQQWNLIFKPARTSRGQEPLLDLVRAGEWAEASSRFLTRSETQVLGLEYWPMYIWAEITVGLFCLVALFCVWRSARQFAQAAGTLTS